MWQQARGHGPSSAHCPAQDSRLYKKTLKRTRRFVVDGVEVSITTSKIISEDEKKDEEMRFLRQVQGGVYSGLLGETGSFLEGSFPGWGWKEPRRW